MTTAENSDAYTGRIYSKCEILETKSKRGYGGANTVILCRCRCRVCGKEYWITAGQVENGRHNGCGKHRTKEIDIDHDISGDAYLDLLYGVFTQAMVDLDHAIRYNQPTAQRTIDEVTEYVEAIGDEHFTGIMQRVKKNAEDDKKYFFREKMKKVFQTSLRN